MKWANGHFSPQTQPRSLPAMPRLARLHAFPRLSQSPEQLHQQCWGHRTDSGSLLQQGTHQPQVSDSPSGHPGQKLLPGHGMRELFLVPGCFHKCSGMLKAAPVPPLAVSIFSPSSALSPWDSISSAVSGNDTTAAGMGGWEKAPTVSVLTAVGCTGNGDAGNRDADADGDASQTDCPLQ